MQSFKKFAKSFIMTEQNEKFENKIRKKSICMVESLKKGCTPL